MPTPYHRYAIYWTPELCSALAAFGAAWFGDGDCQRHTFGLPDGLADRAIRAPARYRLHATLKAPFRPAEGVTASDIGHAIASFCAKRRAMHGPRLKITRFSRYLSLVLGGPSADVDWLAAECVTAFDCFRSPLNDADRATRGPLCGKEAALFEAFGYPYVLSAFEFHISLAGPLEPHELDAVENALAPALADVLVEPLTIESLTLLGDPGGGAQFHILSRHNFMRRRPAQAANT